MFNNHQQSDQLKCHSCNCVDISNAGANALLGLLEHSTAANYPLLQTKATLNAAKWLQHRGQRGLQGQHNLMGNSQWGPVQSQNMHKPMQHKTHLHGHTQTTVCWMPPVAKMCTKTHQTTDAEAQVTMHACLHVTC
jgi:hypothetical protein